jgi:competence protein ComEA
LVPRREIDFSAFDQEINKFYAGQKVVKDSSGESSELKPQYEKNFPPSAEVKTELFAFNPNNLTLEEWLKLGLTEYQANTLRNFVAKGGQFYKKEDMKKIFGISDKLYQRLKPFIRIPEQPARVTFTGRKEEKSAIPLLIDINAADTMELRMLKGIGLAFSTRILDLRNALGGFHKKEQLMEVYGMDSVLYNKIEAHIHINSQNIHKININLCTVYDLKKHPYLSYNIARSLVNYRDRHGKYASVEAIKNTALVNEEIFRKIAPYLTY